MHPREKKRTDGIELVRGDLLPGPLVVLHGADDKFNIIRSFQVRNVLHAIPGDFAAGGHFKSTITPDARVNG